MWSLPQTLPSNPVLCSLSRTSMGLDSILGRAQGGLHAPVELCSCTHLARGTVTLPQGEQCGAAPIPSPSQTSLFLPAPQGPVPQRGLATAAAGRNPPPPHFPPGSWRSPSRSRLPDTHPTAAGTCQSKDFITAFYAFSKLCFLIISACRIMAPHLTCQNPWPFLFLLFGHNFHASNDAFSPPLLFHHNGFFGCLHCWSTSSLAPSRLQPPCPISSL